MQGLSCQMFTTFQVVLRPKSFSRGAESYEKWEGKDFFRAVQALL